jgi:hypothetical protein
MDGTNRDKSDEVAPKSDATQAEDHGDPQPGVDTKLIDPAKTPGSGMFPDDGGVAPSG